MTDGNSLLRLKNVFSVKTRPTSLLLLFIIFAIAAIVLQTAKSILDDQRLTLDTERKNALFAVRLLEEHALQQLMIASQQLDDISNAVKTTSRERTISETEIKTIIDAKLKDSRTASGLQYINPQGSRWVSTYDFPSYVFDHEERDYINWLLAQPIYPEILVGAPIYRAIDSERILPLARNIYDQRGEFLGILSVDVSLAYFDGFYSRIAKDNNSSVLLLADSGLIIVEYNGLKKQNRRSYINHPAVIDVRSKHIDEGSLTLQEFEGESVAKMLTYRKLRNFPLIIVFNREQDQVLAPWRERSQSRLTQTVLIVFVLLTLCFYLYRQMHRLQSSQISLKRSELKFAEFFRHSPVPLAIINLQTDKLSDANTSFLTQFKYEASQVLGKTPAELQLWFQPNLRSTYLQKLRHFKYVDNFEADLNDAQKKPITCLISSRILAEFDEHSCIFSPIDVSDLRYAETQVRQLNNQLELRIEERTRSLQDALDRLTSMQKELIHSEKLAALGMMMAGIAHELNTPIGNCLTTSSSVQAFSEDLSQELSAERPKRSLLLKHAELIQQGSQIISRNLLRSANLIQNFKQIAEIEHTGHYEKLNLRQLVEQTCVNIFADTGLPEVTFHNDIAAEIELNSYPVVITKVLQQLILNSINHGFESKDNGVIEINANYLGQNEWRICVKDNGCGIASDAINKVFDPFFTTKLGHGNSGLGLNLVYNLVKEILRGKLDLESQAGSGTMVCFTLIDLQGTND